jgi:hypothetical protein
MQAPSPTTRFWIASFVFLLMGLLLYKLLVLTDSEIAGRVEVAIPFETTVSINESEVRGCVAASFTLSNTGNFLQENRKEMSSLSHELGRHWQGFSSIDEYTNSISDQHLEHGVLSTIGFAKKCMEELGIANNFLQQKPIFVTHSNTGGQIVLVFQNSGTSGWYFTRGS